MRRCFASNDVGDEANGLLVGKVWIRHESVEVIKWKRLLLLKNIVFSNSRERKRERVCKLRKIKSQEKSWVGKGEGNGMSRVSRELKWNSKKKNRDRIREWVYGLKERENQQTIGKGGGKERLKESETKRWSVRSEKNWKERKTKRKKKKKKKEMKT